ncbi:hypothetical protein GLW08_20605 [Pontibacillus yanchengensis]|uniref:Uncharacterized protein n=2 Tax=Pontibacillus yanchengensis TaxID=462910 RepID=A0ACC7VL43_9BACI|nr:hypothetical protein [Pontibacillus yanchengensis]
MKHLNNEQGNSVFYLIWMLGIVGGVLIIVFNMSNIFIVKQNASMAAEQAALAGTSVILEETQKAIEDFDEKAIAQKLLDGGDTIEEQIDEKQKEYYNNGYSNSRALIFAYNEVLPEKMNKYEKLKEELSDHLSSNKIDGKIRNEVISVIQRNSGLSEETEVEINKDEWYIEVKTASRYETISSGEYVEEELSEDVVQKGQGPSLNYVEEIFN